MDKMSGYEHSGKLGSVSERIEGWIHDGEIGGAALAVAVGDEQIAELHIGEASPGNPATEHTLWQLASIAKSYSAAAIMTLVDSGDLSLLLPVSTVLPEFKGGGREDITLRHLLTHTSGLIYESPVMEQRLLARTSYEELIDEAYLYPLMFQPGTAFSYSDYGIAVAARAVSQFFGTSFPQLVKERLLEPAQLSNTFMPPPASEYKRLAHIVGCLAYGTDGDQYNSPYAIDFAHPSFGTVASISDLLRFGLQFAPAGEEKILSAASVRTMTTDQTGGHVYGTFAGRTSPQPVSWGIGMMIATLGSQRPDLLSPGSFGHTGATGAALWIDPVADVTLAYTSNVHGNNPATGRLPFQKRLVTLVNSVLAELTR